MIMAFHLKPKEEKFFSLLDQHATLSYEAAELLSQAINGEVAKETALKNRRPGRPGRCIGHGNDEAPAKDIHYAYGPGRYPAADRPARCGNR